MVIDQVVRDLMPARPPRSTPSPKEEPTMPEKKRDSVPSTTSVIVYTLEDCPNCELLKGYLTRNNIPFTEEDMSSVESLTELRVNGVFAREAPVLRKGSVFMVSRQLFDFGTVKEDAVASLFKGD